MSNYTVFLLTNRGIKMKNMKNFTQFIKKCIRHFNVFLIELKCFKQKNIVLITNQLVLSLN